MKIYRKKVAFVNGKMVSADKIPGGIADGKSVGDIAKKHNVPVEEIERQIDMGIKIEMEHVDDRVKSREIAMDHLWEMPDYYTKLKKMESEKGDGITSTAKAKIRTRPNPVFDSTHPKVKDNKDHFPLGDADQARNALARANQYSSSPEWWDGTLDELKNAVARKVKKDFPSIEVTEDSTS